MEKSRVSQGQPADQSTHLIERPNTNNWFFQPKSQQRRKGKLYFSSRVPDLDQKILQMNFSHETANADDVTPLAASRSMPSSLPPPRGHC